MNNILQMNLIHFLALLAKYKLSFGYFRPGIVQEIKETLDGASAVWIKLAQTLAQSGDFIGDDLAMALEPLFAQCRQHSHEYSRQIVREELGPTYDTTNMRFIGSGSMAQTYVIVAGSTEVCVKITHPNAYQEIREALATYDAIKDSFLFPRMFVNICWMFFESLRTQLDTGVEFRNMELMCQMFERYNIWWDVARTPMVLTPHPIAHTTNTIVMEYLPGFHISRTNIDAVRSTYDNKKLALVLRSVNFIAHLCIRERLCHLDLHPGNIGFRANPDGTWNVIVYDMGQFFDYRHMTDDIWANAAGYFNITNLLPVLIEMASPESHDMIRAEVPDGPLYERFKDLYAKQFGNLLTGRASLKCKEYLGIVLCSVKVAQHQILSINIINESRATNDNTNREMEYQLILREFGDMDLDLTDWFELLKIPK